MVQQPRDSTDEQYDYEPARNHGTEQPHLACLWVPAHSDCHENRQAEKGCDCVHPLGCPEGAEGSFDEPSNSNHDTDEDQLADGLK
jgi:hypothetical protein